MFIIGGKIFTTNHKDIIYVVGLQKMFALHTKSKSNRIRIAKQLVEKEKRKKIVEKENNTQKLNKIKIKKN